MAYAEGCFELKSLVHCSVFTHLKFFPKGGTAIHAVEEAVRILEDDPAFDAGHGSVLTEDLTVEVDAMIMDGYTLESGTNCTPLLANYCSKLAIVRQQQ